MVMHMKNKLNITLVESFNVDMEHFQFGKTAMYYAETFGHLKVANILSDSSKVSNSTGFQI